MIAFTYLILHVLFSLDTSMHFALRTIAVHWYRRQTQVHGRLWTWWSSNAIIWSGTWRKSCARSSWRFVVFHSFSLFRLRCALETIFSNLAFRDVRIYRGLSSCRVNVKKVWFFIALYMHVYEHLLVFVCYTCVELVSL